MSAILTLALPIGTAVVAQTLMSLTDTAVMGRISVDALAAGSLACNVSLLLVMAAQGLLTSVQPIVAHARGAGDHAAYTRTIAGGLLVALAASVPIILVLFHLDKILIACGEPEHIARLARTYTAAYCFAVPVAMAQTVLRNYLVAIERSRIIIVNGLVAVIVNLGLNWVLVFGHMGMPALGLAGSAYATGLVWSGIAVSYCVFIWRSRLLPEGFAQLSGQDIGLGFRTVLSIGWPIAGAIAIEMGMITALTLAMGHFGSIALAAHQICQGIATLVYTLPLSIGYATTVRVGLHAGAQNFGRARVAGEMAMIIGLGAMALTSILVFSFGKLIFSQFLDPGDPNFAAVLELGGTLIAVAAVFQMFDGAQIIASCALRGLKDTQAALVVNLIGYWGIGLPVGIFLAFRSGLGPVGLWWGFVCGFATAALLLGLQFRIKIGRLGRAVIV